MSDITRWTTRRVWHRDAPLLEDLVGNTEKFFTEHIHTDPLIGVCADLGALTNADTLWDAILRSGARQPAFRIVRAGESTGRKGVTRSVGIGNRRPNDVVDANAVIDRYRSGDTIVLQALHQTIPAAARLATNLSLALDQPTQLNAYLSPPGEQGLDIHFDYHDVIVVQLAGTKSWRIWDPIERTVDPVRTSTPIPPLERDELGEPRIERTLGPGDVLYLPRGFPHVAATTRDPSEHLTIGITAIGLHRYVSKALDRAVEAGAYRSSLPPRSLTDATIPAPPSLDPIAAAMEAGNYRHWMAQQVWRRMPQTRLRPRSIPTTTPRHLRFTPGPLLWLTTSGKKSIVGLGDRLLELPIQADRFLHELFCCDEPIEVGSLDHLDPGSRRIVIDRLIAVGVLAPADND